MSANDERVDEVSPKQGNAGSQEPFQPNCDMDNQQKGEAAAGGHDIKQCHIHRKF